MRAVVVLMVTAVALLAQIQLSGSVISDNQKIISSRYMGFIKEVNVAEGQQVQKGQLLYAIDSKEIDAKKRQAQMSLQMYEDKYSNVMRNLERHKRLYKKDMVAKYEVENLELAAKNLQSMIAISKAQLQEVQNQYKYLQVKAPNDGVIVKKNIKAGEMAIPGTPAIILTDLSSLKIRAEISESNLKEAALNKPVSVEIPSVGLETQGHVDAIIPSSNPVTHSFEIKVSFDAKGMDVYPGMYATITIE